MIKLFAISSLIKKYKSEKFSVDEINKFFEEVDINENRLLNKKNNVNNRPDDWEMQP